MRRWPLSRVNHLLGFSVLLLLLGVSPWGLWERDEGRYADVAREMLARRDFVTPRIDGAVFLDKPPLVYWVTAASLLVWGPGETGARFGQVLFAAGILLVTRRIGHLLFEPRRGDMALLILASSVGFFAGAHVLTLDLALAFFVSLSLLLFLQGYRGGPSETRSYLGMCAALAGGALSKGPVGVVLPALTIACFLTLRGTWRRARDFPWARGLALFAVLVLPWFVAVSIANPEFLRYFFVHEHLQRFGTRVHRHAGSWYYYLAVAAAGLMPWSLLLPLRLAPRPRPSTPWLSRMPDEAPAFLWSWLLPGFLFFSAAQSKLPLYILPLFPAAALLLAARIDRDLRESTRAVFLWPSMLLAVAGAAAALLWRHHGDWELLERAGIGVPLMLLVTALAGGALLSGSILARRGRQVAGLATAAVLWMTACYAIFAVVGRVNFLNQTKHFAVTLGRERLPGEPVFAYQCYLRGLPFYLRETVGLVSPHSDDLRLGRANGHDPDTFPDEASFLERLGGDGRVFVVLRLEDLQPLQKRAGRPLFILARSDSYDLVSNTLGAERKRALLSVLDSTGFDLEGGIERAERAAPGAAIDTIEIERVGGAPNCSVRMVRDGSRVEVDIPMDRSAPVRVERDDPAGEESGAEDHLIRLAPPAESRADIPRLIRDAAGK